MMRRAVITVNTPQELDVIYSLMDLLLPWLNGYYVVLEDA